MKTTQYHDTLSSPIGSAFAILSVYSLYIVFIYRFLHKSEMIDEVSYYTHPLNSWQIGKVVMYHAYIVLKTNDWYWSIEKNDAGVTIQRSKNIEHVRDKYYRIKRKENWTSGIAMEKSKSVNNKTVKQFIEHVYEANYVNEEYGVIQKNCQQFANKIYDFI
uniref:PPPDE domain-containing protein n=1 Tax=Daphnia galeata TaxID=27404 RepID=A0A8J2W653_9CRUS|nr:unnamed protein product [Daphnia galeata]